MNYLQELERQVAFLEEKLRREEGSLHKIKIKYLKKGTGHQPHRGDKVYLKYTGFLKQPNGTKGRKFDSTKDHGGVPFSFLLGLGQVISGWDRIVATMRVGDKLEATIPSYLGYGAKGAGGGTIPPNADLIFVMELVAISKV